MIRDVRPLVAAVFIPAAIALASCSGGGGSGPSPATIPNTPAASAMQSTRGTATTTSSAQTPGDAGSILQTLHKITTIGSTVDPINGDQNPYGLTIAPITKGLLQAGDLVICNFNDAANVQGNGTTIEALHPVPGSTPLHIAQNAALLGCDALALSSGDGIWAAAFGANDNPIVSATGALVTAIASGPWHHPWGQAFSATAGPFGASGAFYASNAGDGSIVRIDLNPGKPFAFDVIATGFPVNGGAPGSILAPSGLTYDPNGDRLYVIDGVDNSITALEHVGQIPAGGVHVSGSSFTGPFASSARRVFAGAPLNGPISAALLPNGNLVVGNTLDPDGTNLLVEVTPSGRVLAKRNVDKGASGAIFGIAVSGTAGEPNNVKIYFNDDNDNTVKVLTSGEFDAKT
ncbi:hypothetical protein WPS_31780 [Vulcanimicrobium alpinum]|uniref:Uncharacterized protein n=1 Tax=Vulcanimicrobium alpinum TaxID=3016050 RepID=A0AAN2CBK4_UNVUL|nr:hypothetical protein [Vulcanimicrobium alpinum]BDE07902.1 hypothetical protein WPS_31780 [Vulcanimicrobium alpinum]